MDKKFSEKKIFLILVVLIVLSAIATVIENTASKNAPLTQTSPAFSYATTTVSTPNGTIVVQIADTENEQIQGLSDRTSLPQGTGMLFVFSVPNPQYMWMKDMNFPLDMVWLDQNKKITRIAADVSPASYKEVPPQIFSSPTPSLYVVELPAGDAARLGLSVGSTLSF